MINTSGFTNTASYISVLSTPLKINNWLILTLVPQEKENTFQPLIKTFNPYSLGFRFIQSIE